MTKYKYKSKLKTTSNIEKITPEIALLQKKFINNIKQTITEHAYNARIELNKNIKIKEYISRLKYINDLFKKLISEMIDKKYAKLEIKNLLVNFNNIFKEDNIILKNEIVEECKKISLYQISLKNELTPLKEQLDQEKNINFILQNNLLHIENKIQRNQASLFMLNNNLCCELEIPIQNDLKWFDELLIDTSKLYQEALMRALKDLNKIKFKNSQKLKRIENLKRLLNNKEENFNIKSIKKVVSKSDKNIENSLSSFNEFETVSSIYSIENIEKKIEEGGIKIKSNIYNLPQKNLIKSNINSKNEKNNNINDNNQKIYLENCINDNIITNKLEFSKLNLKQIQFNQDNKKYKFTSVFRRRKNTSKSSSKTKNSKTLNNVNKEKHELKKKIKQLKNNIRKNKEIIKDFNQFYNSLVDKYDKYIYQPEIESYVSTTLKEFVNSNS